MRAPTRQGDDCHKANMPVRITSGHISKSPGHQWRYWLRCYGGAPTAAPLGAIAHTLLDAGGGRLPRPWTNHPALRHHTQRAQRHQATHVALRALPGARVWLTAPRYPAGRAIDAPLVRAALQRRLRMHVFDEEAVCPCCGDVLDMWGDHCLSCCCAGDRVVRHNSVRNAA